MNWLSSVSVFSILGLDTGLPGLIEAVENVSFFLTGVLIALLLSNC